jgi:hypothetical protein
MGAYMFAVLASLRAAQLMRGCLPRVEAASDKATVVARVEVAMSRTCAMPRDVSGSPAAQGDS